MKRKHILIGMILLALVLTSGTFAYTYNGAAATTLDVVIADAVMTTYEPSAAQPDWNDILPEGDYDSELLLPNGIGDETGIPYQWPETGEHYDKVCDDSDVTYIANDSRPPARDLYQLTPRINVDGSEAILNVTVHFRFAGDPGGEARAVIKTHGSTFMGDVESPTGGAYVPMSYQWDVNPMTNQPWTWEEIDALQAGVSLRGRNHSEPTSCSQVYVAVNYEFVITQGEVPYGDLYDITPHPDYTGDLLIKIYLTNTANLLKACQYLNMKVYVENSLEAEKTPRYQILSLETGVVLFNIEGGSAESYTVQVIGGSYRLMSGDTAEWGEGWSVTPEFYCEATQR